MAIQLVITHAVTSDVNVEVTPVARQTINIDRGLIGPAGPPGPTTITTGTTTTGAAGTSAFVANSGTLTDAVFDFTIPRGDTGATGSSGIGVPAGGAINQVLKKTSATDYDTSWATVTGTGDVVYSTSPTLVTPVLGTPASGTLTNAIGLPVATGISGLATGVATFLATPSSANMAAMLTDETGTGSNVFATSPTLVTPILGTPSSVTLTNATGLPIDTGVSGLAAGVATFLATPNSANLLAAMTNETGTGLLVFGTSPTLTTPVISSIVNTGTLTLPTSTDTLTGRATTDTLTNKRITPRVLASTANSATPTLNTDNYDMMVITGQVVTITSFTTNLTGTPTNGQKLWISITGTAAVPITAWGASFEASTTALPTTTVAGARLDVGFVWNVATSKWRCVAVA